MQRFFIEEKLEQQSFIKLNREIEHQCKNVLRYKDDELIELLDDQHHLALASLKFTDEGLMASIKEIKTVVVNDLKITLIQALIKKDKWEFVLQKATELGVYQIVPLILKRNVVKWEAKEIPSKLKRDQKIIQEAAEQCERLTCPKILAPIRIQDIEQVMSEQNFVAYEDETQVTLKHCLETKQSYSIVIGPEGGFTEDEINQLNEIGFKSVSLGPRILRAETAALVGINTIQTLIEL